MNYLINAQEDKYIFNTIDSLFSLENYNEIIKIHNSQKVNVLDKKIKPNLNFLIAKSYENLNIEDSSLIYYQKSLRQYENNNDLENVAKTNLEIYLTLDAQNNLDIDKYQYLNEIYAYAKKVKSEKWFMEYYMCYGVKLQKSNLPDSSKFYYNRALSISKKLDFKNKQIDLFNLLGSLYNKYYKKNDSAIYYYKRALKLYFSDTLHNKKDPNKEFKLYNNFGIAYKDEKKYNIALEYYKKAENIDLPKLNRKSKKILFNNISATYYYLKDWENAYDYLYKYDSIKNKINLKEQNALISDIQEKYDNEKLRADNLEIESKRKQNKNFLFAALAFILFGGITAFLIQKNTRKKQKLAEQEKALETQKLVTVLKEQELTAIDAMIEGQEKERQRIANDLHDDLGGLMATVKLHFNALDKEKKTHNLFEKTNDLLDEAYNKIRSIAHAKNSGVIANQGLLIAVQNMADKISVSNKINIEVIDHGLENRLENSLELTIFRIIQELVTNIIKHAEATEANIHLTNHDNTINIMIEDNGKGFNPNQVTTKHKGMGINSIDKRVEHLDGKMTIESELNKGTTIIIDIPL